LKARTSSLRSKAKTLDKISEEEKADELGAPVDLE